ncbi:hypothetical protein QBC36DRAFT_371115 [Triangularia setosa]|uniref:Uncharacterized protein n=1 Tax=Triangularia setosa TaxID=2587417 RepID=A0AAN7A0D5_9PEZI|nr:hypothetical protein QBC36DRAFT_371115 [Podospora setosa]
MAPTMRLITEFARQLASIKQGTNLNATEKADEKKQDSVKQSRTQAIDEKPQVAASRRLAVPVNSPCRDWWADELKFDFGEKGSTPSSTPGIDADDDDIHPTVTVLGEVGEKLWLGVDVSCIIFCLDINVLDVSTLMQSQ